MNQINDGVVDDANGTFTFMISHSAVWKLHC